MMDVLKVLLIVQTLAVSSIYVVAEDKKVCHNNLKHYEELRCTPVINQESGCIVSYDCSSISKQKKDKCYYQGKEYSFGEELASSEILSNCIASCRCTNADGRGNFNCANIECAEVFQPSIKKGCVRQYSHDSCCSIGQNCSKLIDNNFATMSSEREKQALSSPDGEKQEKQRATVSSSAVKSSSSALSYMDEPLENIESVYYVYFAGTFVSPYCEDITCDMELHYADYISEGCTPVYYGDDSCCPIYWHCPTKNDTIVKEDVEKDKLTVKNKDGVPKCKFGDLEMEIGQRLAPPIRENCLECSCKVPPFISCAINIECQKKN
ncbi:uncharacterized protein LOC111053952 [Nilaparvata lugens]|uniref:uncharacterized protein LOC111053952 n=1 Tax=Nilaparvata lugens TaxID=108931 RepID=UPI00193E9DA4|nr:uncharacterized protein LOC111053952 [Nilaparvata lugens]